MLGLGQRRGENEDEACDETKTTYNRCTGEKTTERLQVVSRTRLFLLILTAFVKVKVRFRCLYR